MTEYVSPLSEHVKVFPYGSPRNNDPYARILNEQNIRKLIQGVVDKDSFVITRKPDNPIDDTWLESFKFVLYGYYFEVNLKEILSIDYIANSKSAGLYAVIELITHEDSKYETLNGTDTLVDGGTYFQGLKFALEGEFDEADMSSKKYLLVITGAEGDGDSTRKIPPESMLKFDSSSVEIDVNLDDLDYNVIVCGDASSFK